MQVRVIAHRSSATTLIASPRVGKCVVHARSPIQRSRDAGSGEVCAANTWRLARRPQACQKRAVSDSVDQSMLSPDLLAPPGSTAPVDWVRNARARRYILRVTRHGRVRVTIPRGGSEAFARRFLVEKADWIATQLRRQEARLRAHTPWRRGTAVWFRGQPTPLEERDGRGWLGALGFPLPREQDDWRPAVHRALLLLAQQELPALVWSEARRLGTPIRRVSIRNQRTRWGSCSRKGTISLNWRLVQTPVHVRDYLIIHELAHIREMNHSRRYWRWVEEWCPSWRFAEDWLRRHGRELLD